MRLVEGILSLDLRRGVRKGFIVPTGWEYIAVFLVFWIVLGVKGFTERVS